MQPHLVIFLRAMAATLMCVSGIGLVAGLWLRELTMVALYDALLGAVYLIIGIGLFGQSRFALAVAIVVPTVVNLGIYFTRYYTLDSDSAPLQQVHLLRFATDATVVLFSALVLWQLRGRPSP